MAHSSLRNTSNSLIIKDSHHHPDPVAVDTLVLIKRMKRHVAAGCTHCRAVLASDSEGTYNNDN
jgi:hypothetical protein